MRNLRRDLIVFGLALLMVVGVIAYPVWSQAPPAINTIENDVGLYFHTVAADDYFYRTYNVTAFFEALADWLVNHTLPTPVWEETVEWGVAYGRTGDWFNHTLPGEPTVVILQMHPTNHTIHGGLLVFPAVYDKSATQWQLGLYYFNGTQIDEDLLVMYHLRWEPGPD